MRDEDRRQQNQAGENCTRHYGLLSFTKVVDVSIDDIPNNLTRFADTARSKTETLIVTDMLGVVLADRTLVTHRFYFPTPIR